MSIVTLTSDYGSGGLYQASLKGALYSLLPEINLVEISHNIRPHDIVQASFVLRQSAFTFPPGSIHLICLDIDYNKDIIVAVNNDHYFIGSDNGIFPLLFGSDESPSYYIMETNLKSANDSFLEKSVFPLLSKAILEGKLQEVTKLGLPLVYKQSQVPVIDENTIRGTIIYIDGYDNAITNINRELFHQRMVNKSSFAIFYRRKMKIDKISLTYNDSKPGGELAFFNSMNLLEIAMNSGNAGQLLGLNIGSPVIIEYYD